MKIASLRTGPRKPPQRDFKYRLQTAVLNGFIGQIIHKKEETFNIINYMHFTYKEGPPNQKTELSSGGQAPCSTGFPC